MYISGHSGRLGGLFITVQAVYNSPGGAGQTCPCQRPGSGSSCSAVGTPKACPRRPVSRSARSQKAACVAAVCKVIKGPQEMTEATGIHKADKLLFHALHHLRQTRFNLGTERWLHSIWQPSGKFLIFLQYKNQNHIIEANNKSFRILITQFGCLL